MTEQLAIINLVRGLLYHMMDLWILTDKVNDVPDHGLFIIPLRPWTVHHPTQTMDCSSSHSDHGLFIIPLRPWTVYHTTQTMDCSPSHSDHGLFTIPLRPWTVHRPWTVDPFPSDNELLIDIPCPVARASLEQSQEWGIYVVMLMRGLSCYENLHELY